MDALAIAVYGVVFFATNTKAVPPAACFANFRWDDCGKPPVPVMYYWKPGSRCEVAMWRGCLPNPNMFKNEYECVSTCIFTLTVQPHNKGNMFNIDEPVIDNTTASDSDKADGSGNINMTTDSITTATDDDDSESDAGGKNRDQGYVNTDTDTDTDDTSNNNKTADTSNNNKAKKKPCESDAGVKDTAGDSDTPSTD